VFGTDLVLLGSGHSRNGDFFHDVHGTRDIPHEYGAAERSFAEQLYALVLLELLSHPLSSSRQECVRKSQRLRDKVLNRKIQKNARKNRSKSPKQIVRLVVPMVSFSPAFCSLCTHLGLCSDDFLQADKLKKQLDGMVKAPPAVLALTGLQFGDDGAQACTPC
jgi:hypothetical protein